MRNVTCHKIRTLINYFIPACAYKMFPTRGSNIVSNKQNTTTKSHTMKISQQWIAQPHSSLPFWTEWQPNTPDLGVPSGLPHLKLIIPGLQSEIKFSSSSCLLRFSVFLLRFFEQGKFPKSNIDSSIHHLGPQVEDCMAIFRMLRKLESCGKHMCERVCIYIWYVAYIIHIKITMHTHKHRYKIV